MLIYFAGPLFSAAERRFNADLTARLEAMGFSVFLPQRDGVERDNPKYAALTPQERRDAIFAIDSEHVFKADILLFVLDGRVLDEGAAVELGIAYAHKALAMPDKRLVGLMTDVRAAFIGAKLNPMLAVPLEYVADTEDALLAYLEALLPGPPSTLHGATA
jgi:nucleoside 2-deoxyribosyltransferase